MPGCHYTRWFWTKLRCSTLNLFYDVSLLFPHQPIAVPSSSDSPLSSFFSVIKSFLIRGLRCLHVYNVHNRPQYLPVKYLPSRAPLALWSSTACFSTSQPYFVLRILPWPYPPLTPSVILKLASCDDSSTSLLTSALHLTHNTTKHPHYTWEKQNHTLW